MANLVMFPLLSNENATSNYFCYAWEVHSKAHDYDICSASLEVVGLLKIFF